MNILDNKIFLSISKILVLMSDLFLILYTLFLLSNGYLFNISFLTYAIGVFLLSVHLFFFCDTPKPNYLYTAGIFLILVYNLLTKFGYINSSLNILYKTIYLVIPVLFWGLILLFSIRGFQNLIIARIAALIYLLSVILWMLPTLSSFNKIIANDGGVYFATLIFLYASIICLCLAVFFSLPFNNNTIVIEETDDDTSEA